MNTVPYWERVHSHPDRMPPGAEIVHGGCGKLGCQARGWALVTNAVEYGETVVTESWEAWCPAHGVYGQAGSSDVWYACDEVTDHMTDEQKARYCGFRSVEEFRREMGTT